MSFQCRSVHCNIVERNGKLTVFFGLFLGGVSARHEKREEEAQRSSVCSPWERPGSLHLETREIKIRDKPFHSLTIVDAKNIECSTTFEVFIVYIVFSRLSQARHLCHLNSYFFLKKWRLDRLRSHFPIVRLGRPLEDILLLHCQRIACRTPIIPRWGRCTITTYTYCRSHEKVMSAEIRERGVRSGHLFAICLYHCGLRQPVRFIISDMIEIRIELNLPSCWVKVSHFVL